MSSLESIGEKSSKYRGHSKISNTKQKNRFSAVVFDFDGTLADSFELIIEIFYTEVKKRLPDVTQDQILSISKNIFEKEIEEKMKSPKKLILVIFYKACREMGFSRPTSSYITLQAALKIQKRYNQIKVFPNAEELLKLLNKEAVPTILITLSSKKRVLEILKQNDLEKYFQIVIDKKDLGDVEKSKGIKNALHALGVTEDELDDVIVLGDLPTDIKDGKNVGTKTGAVLTGPIKPDRLIDSDPDYVFADLNDFVLFFKQTPET